MASKLPPELWTEVGKRLHSRLDVGSFRSVCREWRSCLPRPNRFPLRVPPPPGALENKLSYLITEVESYEVLGRCDVRQRCFVPFEGTEVVSFEGTEEDGLYYCSTTFEFSPSNISRLSLIAKSYRTCIAPPCSLKRKRLSNTEVLHSLTSLRKSARPTVKQTVVISSNAVGNVATEYASLSDISVVALLEKGKLAILRLDNNSDWEICASSYRFVSIAAYDGGQLVACDAWAREFLMDYHSLQMTQVDVSIQQHPELYATRKLVNNHLRYLLR